MDDFEDLDKYYGPSTATPISPVPAEGEYDDLDKYYPNNQSAKPQAFGFNELPGYEGEGAPYVDPEIARNREMINTAKDVGASIGTRLPVGVVAGAVGLPGSLEQMGQMALPLAAEKSTDFLTKQGFMSPAEQEKYMAGINQPGILDFAAMGKQALLDKYVPSLGSALTKGREAGYVSRSGLPTYEGVSAAMKKVAPFLEYKSKTTPGEYFGEGAETAGGFALGPAKGLMGRLFLGTSAGFGAKAGEKFAENQDFDPVTGKILGTVSGFGAGALGLFGSRYLPGRTAPAKADLAKTLDAYNVESTTAARRLSEGPDLQQIRDLTSQRTGTFLGTLTPEKTPLTASTYQARIASETADETKRIYRLSMSSPEAQSIPSRMFSPLEKYPVFNDALQQAAKDAVINPKFKIVVPQKATSTTPEVFGNLAFYDQVYKNLGRTLRAELRADAPNNAILTSAANAKTFLGKRLDLRVKGYADARNAHIEAIGATNAVDAGYDFLKNMPELKQGPIVNSIKKMSPQQREGFSYGILQNIQDEIGKGNICAVAKQMTMKPIYRERLELALGPEVFAQVRGKVLGENLIEQAAALQVKAAQTGASKSSNLGRVGIAGGLAGAGVDAVVAANQVLMSTMGMAPGVGASAAAGAAAFVGTKALYNKAERVVAQKMIPMITEGTPESFAKLSKLMDESRSAKIVYDKLYHVTALLARQASEEIEPEEPRADGGRVGRANGGRVGVDVEADALIRAAERSKKDFNRTTEPLLNTPDNHIAKALEVANRAI